MPEARRPRLAIVSPFLDKRHGTERRVVEWATRLADRFEIHVYSQRVEDIDPSRIVWHRIPRIPGPHVLNFLWWFAANRLWRVWDCHFRGVRHDLVFSPGVNCLDADVVSVHVVFAEYGRRVAAEVEFGRNPVSAWMRLLHRRVYYRLVRALERRVYSNPRTVLVLIARKTALELQQFGPRAEPLPVIYLGLDHAVFNPQRRGALRDTARAALGLAPHEFALLLVGNDWRNKGVPVLLAALAQLRDASVHLFVVSAENPLSCDSLIANHHLQDRVRFVPPRNDIEFYYAAADAYAGPSLEDTFAQPPAEAMACGLPTIVSASNGTCEIITDGVDGMILADPTDASALAVMIRHLHDDPAYRRRMGDAAAATALQYTWERNGRDLGEIFESILSRKARVSVQSLGRKS